MRCHNQAAMDVHRHHMPAPKLVFVNHNAIDPVFAPVAGVACVSVATQQLHKPSVWPTSTPPACLQAWRRSVCAAPIQSSWLELGWPGCCMHTSACCLTHRPGRPPLAACSPSPSFACRSLPFLSPLVCLICIWVPITWHVMLHI